MTKVRNLLGVLVGLSAMGLAGACQSETRDFEPRPEAGGEAGEGNGASSSGGSAAGSSSGGTAGTGGSSGAGAECSDGEAECVEGEAATARACSKGAWKTTKCEGETPICLEGRCLSCEPGSEECRNNVAHRCDEDGSWESLNACSGSEVECADCTLGQECTDESDCGEGACVDNSCVECEPDDTACVGVTPRICSTDGTWINQAPCSGKNPICDEDTGSCVCEDGDHSCLDKDTEEVCVDGAWEETDCRAGCLIGQGVDGCRTDTLATPGVVACDLDTDTTCDVSDGKMCCLAQNGVAQHTCTTNCPSSTETTSVGHKCDSHSDCADGWSCCYLEYFYHATACNKNPVDCHNVDPGGIEQRLVCDPDGEPCPEGRLCKPRPFSTSFMTVDVGLHTCEDP